MLINNNAFRTFCAHKIYALGMNKKGCKEGQSSETHLEISRRKSKFEDYQKCEKIKSNFSGFIILTLQYLTLQY